MQAYEAILEQVREVLAPFARSNQPITEESRLVADLGLDSMAAMDLLLEIEDRFDLSIPLNVLPDISTVRELALYVQRLTETLPQGTSDSNPGDDRE